MRVGSLFAGIGGFDLGLERAGMRTIWQVEIDSFRRAVLAQHFPDAERYEDVREVGADNLAPVGVICGGFPCQDISLAGKGAGGIDGERSGLWSEMFRIVRELEPRWLVVENVPALTSRGLDRVLRDLASGGYDAEWDCLPASAFGAPHRRDRIWIVAYPSGIYESNQPRGLEVGPQLDSEAQQDPADRSPRGRHADGLRDQVADAERPGPQGHRERALRPGAVARSGEGGRELPDAPAPGLLRAEQLEDHRAGGSGRGTGDPDAPGEARGGPGWWATEPDVGRVAHGVPARVDRLAALGDSLVPQIAEWIGRRLMTLEQEES